MKPERSENGAGAERNGAGTGQSEAELRRNALARLDYVLRQKSEPRKGPADRRPGLLV